MLIDGCQLVLGFTEAVEAPHKDKLLVVLGLLVAAVVMFAINRPRMDAVALIMIVALPFTGVISINQAIAGFADANIVLIAALFVIGDGLVRTGVARRLGDLLQSRAGASETRLIALLMLVVCGLGSMMSSTAVTAIFIPVALRISQTTGTSPRRLMMPLSFAALISGMMTLVATAPNLVVSSELERNGLSGFAFFSFTPFGVPILILGVVYMLFARRLLGGGGDSSEGRTSRPSMAGWIQEYHLTGREHRARVHAGSPIVGKTLADLQPRQAPGASLIGIERDRQLIQPTAQTVLLAGDILLVDFCAPAAEVAVLRDKLGLEELPLAGGYFTDRSQDIGMAEVILPASSEFIGKTIAQAKLRTRTGLTAIGLRRGVEAKQGCIHEEVLKIGDTLLLLGPWKTISNLQGDGKSLVVLNLPAEHAEVLPVAGRVPHAVACLLLVVILMVTGWVPNVQAALIGCLLMGLLGCIDLQSSYRSIDWKTIVLIVGMLPFSTALQRTGGVELAANALMSVTSGAGPRVILACLFALTAMLGLFISNTATAVLMAPVAIAVAKELGLSPYPFAMTVALAASTAFMTPVSSPVNTLVVAPGRYTFGDFVKVGTPFALVVMVVSVFMVPWLLPLQPKNPAKPATPITTSISSTEPRIPA